MTGSGDGSPYSSPAEDVGSARPLAQRTSTATALWAVVAAFGAYFCMYGLRKPFAVATYEGQTFGLWEFKVFAVSAQVLGYMTSKFLGIKFVSELHPSRRAAAILVLVVCAELALLLFAVVPAPYNAICLFLNGLPLGMVFGLVLGFLEGRCLTEAMAAGLCASFVLADGVVKSVGAWLLRLNVAEFWMPSTAGLIFLIPLAGFVWMLAQVPPPLPDDLTHRSERTTMSRQDRRALVSKHAIGLSLLIVMYLIVTILRSIRADFAPELWTELGAPAAPSTFTFSESIVALGVLLVNGASILIRDNRRAFLGSLGVSLAGMTLIVIALVGRRWGMTAFPFMVCVGLGFYLPYVAMHTTVFERLLAMTRDKGNIAFLLYLADAVGYLGYVVLIMTRGLWEDVAAQGYLQFFLLWCWVAVGVSTVSLIGAWRYFDKVEVTPVGTGESP